MVFAWVALGIGPMVGLASLATLLAFALAWVRRPRPFSDIRSEALLLGAHPDDCAIVAGEYALEVLGRSGRVRVLYLTAGDERPDSERSRERMREAHAVWTGMGVKEADLETLGHPEAASPDAPSRICEEALLAARLEIEKRIKALAPGAAVVLPADGEGHVDHRTLRALALEALQESGRSDLLVLDGPAYNGHLSVVRAPWRALAYLLGLLPVVGSRLSARLPATPTPFVSKGNIGVLTPEPERFARKKEMLRGFVSEDGELLVRFFGFPDRLRVIDATRPPREGWALKLGERNLAPSMLIALGCLLGALLLLAASAGAMATALLPQLALVVRGAAVAAAVGLIALALLRTRDLERRLVFMSAALGLILGVL